ncbi:hypothetical protein HDU84_001623 [Entophlyctis sp. JEL0112]|nr:hypothetical protein HDU84_001623 [Entophlyctis sp. JEL0112]
MLRPRRRCTAIATMDAPSTIATSTKVAIPTISAVSRPPNASADADVDMLLLLDCVDDHPVVDMLVVDSDNTGGNATAVAAIAAVVVAFAGAAVVNVVVVSAVAVASKVKSIDF